MRLTLELGVGLAFVAAACGQSPMGTDDAALPADDLTVNQDLVGADLFGSAVDSLPPSDLTGPPSDLTGVDLYAPPIPCGNETCDSDHACVEYIGGVPADMTVTNADLGPPVPNRKCWPVPPACAGANRSCACLDQNGGSHAFCDQAFPQAGTFMCYGNGGYLTCGGI